ncbi:hypothetical protein MUN82_10310 [Hymenobacter aerilatus]|uniref:Uncharacterized protein n=1 Tax=Hymenobacter aerilatus TaxID=2932251 RepID=A0A8T9T4B5_9BACT|nr:hypothetical protein [Hymenobacter aerilatus]UOR07470.1 hypothetical protein MUN82_10310 [Hymenobacter aerilatus]
MKQPSYNQKYHKVVDVKTTPGRVYGKVVNRLLRFDLPFVVMVKDSVNDHDLQEWDKQFKQGNDITVKSAYTPTSVHVQESPVYIPTEFIEPYSVVTSIGIVKIGFLRRNNPELPLKLHHEFYGSVSKALSFTTVYVEFDDIYTSLPLNSDDDNEGNNTDILVDGAMEALNKFLVIYKIINEKHYIPQLTTYGIGKYQFLDVDENDNSLITQVLKHYGTPVSFEDTHDYQTELFLRNGLLDNHEFATYIRIYQDVWYKITTHDWRMAVADSLILFESWIRPYLHKIYTEKGLSKNAIKNKFKVNGNPMFITDIAAILVEDATGYAFQDSREYADLLNKAIKVRNKVIHLEKYDVQQIEARGCFYSVCNAISAIAVNGGNILRGKPDVTYLPTFDYDSELFYSKDSGKAN